MPSDPVVAGGVCEGDRDPDERLIDAKLERRRDLDRGRRLAPARAVGPEPDRPVVAGDDLERSTDRAALDRLDDDDRWPIDDSIRRRRPVVVGIAEVAAVDDPTGARQAGASADELEGPVVGDRHRHPIVRDRSITDDDATGRCRGTGTIRALHGADHR